MLHRADAPPAGGSHRRRGFDPSLRIGDAERGEVIDALGQHFTAGRLDRTELDERLGQASAAKIGADLAGILADLPPLATSAPPARPAPARPWRSVLWVAVAMGILLLSVPWEIGPWGWWFPHPPVFLAGVVLLAVWVRRRRRRWRTAHDV